MTEYCTFTYEPDGDSDDSFSGWECPHDVAAVSDEYCLFHLTEAEREEVDDDRVSEKFLDCISSTGPTRKLFMGARIDVLDLNYQRIDAPDNYPVVLYGATIAELKANHTQFEQPFLLSHSGIATAEFSHSTFNSPCELDDTSIGWLDCSNTDFLEYVTLDDSDIVTGQFEYARFSRELSAEGATFHIGAKFTSAMFGSSVSFEAATFESAYTNFEDYESEYDRMSELYMTVLPMSIGRRAVDPLEQSDEFIEHQQDDSQPRIYYSERAFVDDDYINHSDITFNGGDFRRAHFSGDANFSKAEFEFVDFGLAEFDARARFVDTRIYGLAHFHGSEFQIAEMRFYPMEMSLDTYGSYLRTDSPSLGHVYLTDSSIANGRLEQPEEGDVFYNVRDACLGQIDLLSDGNPFDTLIVRNTRFDGFDFTEYRDDLAAINWEVDGAELPGLQRHIERDESTREVTYLKAKQGAAQVGDTHAESEFFQREMIYRKSNYKIDITEDRSYVEFQKNLFRSFCLATLNDLYRVTTGYGEKPHRVVLSYLVLLLALSSLIMFPLLAEGDVDSFLEGVRQVGYMLTFGDTTRVPEWFSSFVALFQVFVIPSFIAMLLFTIDRSIAR